MKVKFTKDGLVAVKERRPKIGTDCANCLRPILRWERRIPYTSRIVIHKDCEHNQYEYAEG